MKQTEITYGIGTNKPISTVWCRLRTVGSTLGQEACSRQIQCQPGQWRGSRDLGLQTFLPCPDSLHQYRRFKAFRHCQQAGGQGPPVVAWTGAQRRWDPLRDVIAFEGSHLPHRPNDSCRKPLSSGFYCASSSTGWDVLHPLPQTPIGTTPFTAFPWPVRHRDSSGSRPHT